MYGVSLYSRTSPNHTLRLQQKQCVNNKQYRRYYKFPPTPLQQETKQQQKEQDDRKLSPIKKCTQPTH